MTQANKAQNNKPSRQDDLFKLLGTPEFDEAMAARLGVEKHHGTATQAQQPKTSTTRATAQRTVQEVLEELHPETPEEAQAGEPNQTTTSEDDGEPLEERISEFSLSRFPNYIRVLEELHRKGVGVVTSKELANYLPSFHRSVIRRDLCAFGKFGLNGQGYVVRRLLHELRRATGMNTKLRVALLGVDVFANALLLEFRRSKQHEVVAIFDREHGQVQGLHIVQGLDVSKLTRALVEHAVDLVVLNLRHDPEAPLLALEAYKAGVRCFINCTGLELRLPEDSVVEPFLLENQLARVLMRKAHPQIRDKIRVES